MNRIEAYIDALDEGNTALLDRVEAQAKQAQIPMIRRSTQMFLKTMLQIKRPEAILEIGTGNGFSALLMHTYNPVRCRITTMEIDERRCMLARENFAASGWEQDITLLAQDAAEALAQLEGTFDFIFMDGPKGQYLHYLPHIERLLAPEGILVSDNVFQEGDVIESRYAVTHRDRTIHERMREYLYLLTHSPAFSTSVLPAGDGIALTVKNLKTQKAD